MKDKLVQSAMIYLATIEIQLSIIEDLKGTVFYKHRIKYLLKSLKNENEKNIERFYQNLDDVSEDQFYKISNLIESFLMCVSEKGLSETVLFIDELRQGKVAVMDEIKHKKIFKQLEKV